MQLFSLVSCLGKRFIFGIVCLCFHSTSVLADKASYPEWSIAVANEKCKLWEEYGYDYYEVRNHMNVKWSEEFEKEFSRLQYQEAIDLSREVTGFICQDLQDEAWDRFRDKQADLGLGDDLRE